MFRFIYFFKSVPGNMLILMIKHGIKSSTKMWDWKDGKLKPVLPHRVRMAVEAMRKSLVSTVALTGPQLGLKILPLEIFHDLCKSCVKTKINNKTPNQKTIKKKHKPFVAEGFWENWNKPRKRKS